MSEFNLVLMSPKVYWFKNHNETFFLSCVMLRKGILLNKACFFHEMSKKPKKSSIRETSTPTETQLQNDPIKSDKEDNIIIQVYAKPGAKQNSITGITSEGVNVQINAPPMEGAANSELIKYVASVLGLRPGNILLERGHKSRQKVLKVSGKVTLEEAKQKISEEINSN